MFGSTEVGNVGKSMLMREMLVTRGRQDGWRRVKGLMSRIGVKRQDNGASAVPRIMPIVLKCVLVHAMGRNDCKKAERATRTVSTRAPR